MSAPADPATRYGLTDAGWAALAVDEAIQAALDAEALDAIAALLRSSPREDGQLLDRIAEHVAASRRHIRAKRIE
ncbi:hypothetical protein [Jatrophihabitans lederbergiae]|uniref:Uncharacterized protein n=1 Tax=Jatrophihabitans lederbergiae TaxID=3075547 RepID=A0ABU2JIK0_9ACTN|nr:hypothetical protein [Jatrophihabitans sp. DSM 44399]MDT0264319.1 hypothetical protein [Jatrophihabitans sp. DSM 44399]